MSNVTSPGATHRTTDRVNSAPQTSSNPSQQQNANTRAGKKKNSQEKLFDSAFSALILSPSLAGLLEGEIIKAKIIGLTENNLPIGRTKDITALIITNDALPVNTLLSLRIDTISQEDAYAYIIVKNDELLEPAHLVRLVVLDTAIAGNANSLASGGSAIASSEGWPALQDLLKFLSVNDPLLTKKMTTKNLPNFGPRSTVNLFLLMTALYRGNFNEWIGKTVIKFLESSNQREILEQLSEEFESQSSQLKRQDVRGWRSLTVPFFAGLSFYPVHLSARVQKKKNNGSSDGLRFIIDLEFNNLGQVQLDGLTCSKNLDLFVRSKKTLSGKTKVQIQRIFNEISSITSLNGQLYFQVKKNFFFPSKDFLPAGFSPKRKHEIVV